MLEKFGIVDGADNSNSGKLTFKHKIVNEKESNQINHHTSQHTLGL